MELKGPNTLEIWNMCTHQYTSVYVYMRTSTRIHINFNSLY